MSTPRIEHDTLGPVEVPHDALYGAQTARAVANFPLSGRPLPWELIRALVEIKAAVESGTTFAEALKKFPGTFDPLFRNLIAAGEIGGILDLKRDEDVPPHWMHYIRVPSVESAIERAEANGGTVIIGAHQVPDGAKTACLSDPQGAIFSVWSPPGS